MPKILKKPKAPKLPKTIKKVKKPPGVGWLCTRGEYLRPPAGRWHTALLDPATAAPLLSAVPVYVVYKRTTHGWRPWLVLAQSVALTKVPHHADDAGYGAWSLRQQNGPRARGEYGAAIGPYSGLIVARGPTEYAARLAVQPLVAGGARHLLCIKRGSEWLVIDGAVNEPESTTPQLGRSNDARNTGATPTCVTSVGGVVHARRRIPPLDLSRPLTEQADSELTWDYLTGYWGVHDPLAAQ